jgi:hypothetical protein
MRTKLSLLLVSALLVGSAGGRAYGAVVVDSQSFKGSQAATTFTGSRTISCGKGKGSGTVTASGFLQGSQTITKATGSPTTVDNGTFIEISYTNSCTGASLSFADGGTSNGFTPPSSRLNSAEVAGTTSVTDFSTGTTATVAFDVVFEGTGAITTSKSTTTTKTKGPLTITITSQGSSTRAASASGTITVNGIDVDAIFDPTSTTLSSNANATVTITKN